MATLTTILGTDTITSSRTVINQNFTNLNADKVETSVLDVDTTLASNSDLKVATQKAVKAYVDAGGNVNASETTRGIVEEATDAEVTAGTAVGATSAKLFVTPAKLINYVGSPAAKFGGNGSNGALSITSGTTTIDLASQEIVYLNYTTISITGTGQLAFINKAAAGTVVYMQCQGAVTLTSSATPNINLDSLGADGGTLGNAGTDGFCLFGLVGGGQFPGFGTSGVAALGGIGFRMNRNLPRQIHYSTGSGGGASTDNATNNTVGATGGGGLVIECRGAFNFTGSIYARGATSASGGAGGSGGGGGGGSVYILYNTLTANTGSVLTTGGLSGAPGAAGSGDNGGGGGGSSANNGSPANATSRAGGAGGSGFSFIGTNIWFF